jgi:hypothetical protein
MFPDVALIVVVWADPTEGAAVKSPELFIVPALEFDEFHCALDVMSCVIPSDVVAMAVNCTVVPCSVLLLVGLTAMRVMLPSETVSVVVPVTVPEAALSCAVPTEIPVTNPDVLMLATVGVALLQNKLELNVFVVPSL